MSKRIDKNSGANYGRPGFTIIEVVMVLAIAGLIFLMVFVALPSLQRSQRDATRKCQVSLILDAFDRCKTLNRGRCYTSSGDKALYYNKLVDSYITDQDSIADPSTREVPVYIGWSGDLIPGLTVGQIIFDSGDYCDGDGIKDYPPTNPKTNTTIAIAIRLENGSVYCASNDQR